MNWKLLVGGVLGVLGFFSSGHAAAEVGVSDSTITVGQSIPLSGPLQELGIDMKQGIQLYFDQINRQGGVNGRMLELKALDDGYDPERTAANTRQLIGKDGVFSLIGYVGTPTSLAALQVSGPAKVPFFGAFTGADALRTPFNRYVFNVRASYAEECDKIVEQFTSLNVKRIAVIFQNDAFGKSVLNGVERAMEKRGLQLVGSAAIERNSLNVAAAAKSIGAVRPDMVIMAVLYKPAAAIVGAIRSEGLAPQFYTGSFVGPQALARELGAQGAGVGVSQVMPFPWSSNAPIVREYQKSLTRTDARAEPSYVGLEGFVAAKIFVEGLKRAGKDLTREKFVGALEGMRNYDAGGYAANFTPTDHNGSKFVELTVLRRDGKYMH